jgi:hypothetical protein
MGTSDQIHHGELASSVLGGMSSFLQQRSLSSLYSSSCATRGEDLGALRWGLLLPCRHRSFRGAPLPRRRRAFALAAAIANGRRG